MFAVAAMLAFNVSADDKKPAKKGRGGGAQAMLCLLYTSPSPRDRTRSRMPSSA